MGLMSDMPGLIPASCCSVLEAYHSQSSLCSPHSRHAHTRTADMAHVARHDGQVVHESAEHMQLGRSFYLPAKLLLNIRSALGGVDTAGPKDREGETN